MSLHPRLRNAREKIAWSADHVYVGRPGPWGDCPCRRKGCTHSAGLGNPFSASKHGVRRCVELFHGMLFSSENLQARVKQILAAPKIAVCWCDGFDAVWCHGETYLRVADGEDVRAIERDVLARLARMEAE